MSAISVVIPAYNDALHLGEAIASVRDQTLPAQTIIVVDDGSDDDTAAVALRFGDSIHYLRQDHAGAAKARNTGVDAVSTEYLAFLDSDDVWEPQKLEWQMAHAGPSTMIFGHVRQFASPELSAEEVSQLRFDDSLMRGVAPSGLFMRTADFRRVGPFDVTSRTGEFIEWYARAQRAGLSSVVLPDLIFRRRLHRSNSGRRKTGQDYARTVKSILDARRKSP